MKSLQQFIKETVERDESMITEAGMAMNRLLTKHADAGYIILSASRHENDKKTNDILSRELRRDIRDAGYSFKTVEGGYIEDIETNPHEVVERSYIVFCYDKKGIQKDFEKLKRFGIEMCGKYKQDSVLIADPASTPTYFDENGNAGTKFGDKVAINRAVERFFTRLGNTRFTFKESRMEDWHSVMDRHCRHLMGEIF